MKIQQKRSDSVLKFIVCDNGIFGLERVDWVVIRRWRCYQSLATIPVTR